MTKKVLIKPKGKHGYNMETLLKRAQYWEVDMVNDVEEGLIPLRREASFIAKAIGQLNYIPPGNIYRMQLPNLTSAS